MRNSRTWRSILITALHSVRFDDRKTYTRHKMKLIVVCSESLIFIHFSPVYTDRDGITIKSFDALIKTLFSIRSCASQIMRGCIQVGYVESCAQKKNLRSSSSQCRKKRENAETLRWEAITFSEYISYLPTSSSQRQQVRYHTRPYFIQLLSIWSK